MNEGQLGCQVLDALDRARLNRKVMKCERESEM